MTLLCAIVSINFVLNIYLLMRVLHLLTMREMQETFNEKIVEFAEKLEKKFRP